MKSDGVPLPRRAAAVFISQPAAWTSLLLLLLLLLLCLDPLIENISIFNFLYILRNRCDEYAEYALTAIVVLRYNVSMWTDYLTE